MNDTQSNNNKILILDDDPDILALLQSELKRAGHQVECVDSAQKAISSLEKQDYFAAIFDIVLGPNSTSEGVIRYIHDAPRPSVRKLPIIISSAFLNDNLAKKVEAKGVNVYRAIKKPFKKNQIAQMLTQLKNDLDHGVFVVLSKEEQILDHEIKHESDLMDKIDTSLVPKDKIELQNRFNQAELAKNDPEWRNQKGETALMIFAEKGDLIGVKSQLQYKQNLNLKANDGSTAIHHAIACGQIEIVKILHEAGAKINLRDNNESEALALAIERKNYLVADYLINQGARIDIIYQGMTYLMLAMKHDDLALFNRLLAAGADPSIKNHQGKDIKMLAREQNKKNFLRILNTMMI